MPAVSFCAFFVSFSLSYVLARSPGVLEAFADPAGSFETLLLALALLVLAGLLWIDRQRSGDTGRR